VQAFIVFENPSESRRATQKDRELFGERFGDRYVRVYPTLESDLGDMLEAVHQQQTMSAIVSAVPALEFSSRGPRGLRVGGSRCAVKLTRFRLSLNCAQGNGGHGGMDHSVVKIKSLPFDATQLDIIQFFQPPIKIIYVRGQFFRRDIEYFHIISFE
jgi:hypothetical protein